MFTEKNLSAFCDSAWSFGEKVAKPSRGITRGENLFAGGHKTSGGILMKNLKENSIHIHGTVTVVWPQHQREEELDMSDIRSKFNGAFSTNNSTICFVHDNEVFVTPWTSEALATIAKAGLDRKSFYVPFSNGDYPKHEEAKWSRLRNLAHESYCREYEIDCANWCDEHHISALSADIMANCFRIPREGIFVKHPHYETTHYPICGSEMCLDSFAASKLGCFCSNNGRVVFVYRDGHTYVTKGYRIISELREAGFKEASLYVPFSNGEAIVDPALAAQWNRISKK